MLMLRIPLPTLVASLALTLAAGCSSRLAPDPQLRGAWSEYYSTLVDVQGRLQGSAYFDGPVAQAEAYRYLASLASLHNRLHVHFADPLHPVFVRWVGTDTRWGFSNPDVLYLTARVSQPGAYRIRGRLGSAYETTIGSHAGEDARARNGDRIRGVELETDANGSFELVVSDTPEPGNWLRLEPGAARITVYQLFADWDREARGSFHIERIGEEGRAPPPLTPEVMARRLTLAARALRSHANTWIDVADGLSFLPVNTLARPEALTSSALGRWVVSGHYEIASDEALLVEVPAPPHAGYWGWSLHNGWSESLDAANRQTSLNSSQARVDADGVLRLVLAERDPGVPNWLDTTGHPKGIMLWRVMSGDPPERPTARTIALSDLADALPRDTPRVDPAQRRAAGAARQRHLADRYAN
jgi:hypothetical protein